MEILNDGKAVVIIHDNYLNTQEYTGLFEEALHSIEWKSQTYNFGRGPVVAARKVFAFSDDNVDRHGYSGQALLTLPWNSHPVGQRLREIRDKIRKEFGIDTNAVLLNYYPDGNAAITAHNDKEVIRGTTNPIATPVVGLSLGATRKFKFAPLKGVKDCVDPVTILVKDNQLMIMNDKTNLRYEHGIPYEKKIKEARISATFRLLPTK